jgi:uncharacterized protein YyaL (SSP411 family)
MQRSDGGLYHNYKSGKATINGYLEDYALAMEAFIRLYEATFDEAWLQQAKSWADYAFEHFFDPSTAMFFFTSDLDQKLIARKMEINDNVIPASNSSLARSLYLLGFYFEDSICTETAKQMLNNIQAQISSYGSGYSNWGMLMLQLTKPFYQVAIAGKEAGRIRSEFSGYYFPNTMYIGTENESLLPLLENKFVNGKTIVSELLTPRS